MYMFVNTWKKHKYVKPSITSGLHYNNCTFNSFQRSQDVQLAVRVMRPLQTTSYNRISGATSARTQGKAILVLGWMGNTGCICAGQTGSARVSPLALRPVTTSGHHHTTQLSCSPKQQSHLQEAYRKKPLAHVNSQSYQFNTGASWVTMHHTWGFALFSFLAQL